MVSRLSTSLLAVALIVVASLAGAQRLVVTPKGQLVKTIGSGIIFTCTLIEYPGNSVPLIRWMNVDGQPITNTVGRKYIERESKRSIKLYIRSISGEDAGKYTCSTSFQDHVMDQVTEVILYEEIEFKETPTKVTSKVGDRALLPCQAAGNPQPHISWRFKRKRVPSHTYKYTYEADGLRITAVEREDAGQYECRAEVVSQGALKIRAVELDVLYAPVMVKKPESSEVIKGQNLTLGCVALGHPAVVYEWHKEQVLSGGIKLKVKLGRGPDKSTHLIKKVLPRDEGTYYCRASNEVGSVEGHADIKVLIPPAIDPLAYKVQVVGDVLIMPCRAAGVPEPAISWHRVGTDIVYTGDEVPDDPRIQVDNSHRDMIRLIINGVQATDSGIYTCVATNKAGQDARNGTIRVEYKPVMVSKPVEVYAWKGQMRTFNCTADGVPDAAITWFKGREYLRSNGTYFIEGNRRTGILKVTVSQGTDWVYGQYECNAKNPHGTTVQKFSLLEARTPPEPQNVTVVDTKMSTVTISAQVPAAVGGLPVTSWRLSYTKAKGKSVPLTFFYKSGDRIIVRELRAGMLYNFLLCAGNIVGFGKEAKFRVRTPREIPMAPTAAPRTTTERDVKGGNHTLLRSKQEKGLEGEKGGIVSEKKQQPDTGNGFVIAIVGVVLAIILVALTGLIAFIVCRRKRGQREGVRTVLRKKGKSKSKDVDDGFELNMRRKESPLPDVVHKDSNGSVTGEIMPNGHAAVPLPGVPTPLACMSPNMHIKQRAAWDQMIRRAEMESEDEMEEEKQPEVESPYNELPPPPPFLLDSTNDGNYADIFDGYHSGDNVDDDIDDLGQPDAGYVITLPRHPNDVSYT